MTDALMTARKILQAEKGLARLPKPDNREAVALAAESWGEIERRGLAAGVEVAVPVHRDVVQLAENRLAAKAAERDAADNPAVVIKNCAFTSIADRPIGMSMKEAERLRDQQRVANRRGGVWDRPEAITKRKSFGRVMTFRQKIVDGVAYVLHATRGWRKA